MVARQSATSAGLVTLAGPRDHAARPGTIGRALRGVEVVLRGAGGAPVPVGEVGELYARSATLVTGYHGDPAATAAATRDGAFTFLKKGKRKYWRMQSIDNPCDLAADYVDLYLR